MQVQQVHSVFDVVYNQQRKQVYTTLKDTNGQTFVQYQAYYYPLYTKRGVLEVQKGSTIDLKV